MVTMRLSQAVEDLTRNDAFQSTRPAECPYGHLRVLAYAAFAGERVP